MKIPALVRFTLWTVGALGVIAVGASLFAAHVLTGAQRKALRPLPEGFGFMVETVHFPTEDGLKLAGWFVPCPDSKKGAILLHGNGTTRSQMIGRAKLLRQHGYAVLLYDARAHGESEGDLVSVGWHEKHDLLGALAFMRSHGAIEIGCLGVSQGGATIALAADQLSGLRWAVLESVYPDIETALDRRFRYKLHLPGWLVGMFMLPAAEWRLGVAARQIAPVKTISKLPCPVLIASGSNDHYTTEADTRTLFTAAHEVKSLWLVPGAGHVDLYGFGGRAYEDRLLEFISSVEIARN